MAPSRVIPSSLVRAALFSTALTLAGAVSAAPPSGAPSSSAKAAGPATSAKSSAPAPSSTAADSNDDPSEVEAPFGERIQAFMLTEEFKKLPAREQGMIRAESEVHWEDGPFSKSLGHGVTLKVPKGYRFISGTDANKLLKAMGNDPGTSSLGAVRASRGGASADGVPWTAYIDYSDDGYVKDDESIDQAALLKDLREGQEEANKTRIKQGHPALTLTGWLEPPAYDRAKHHLVWALGVRTAEEKDEEAAANYETRILGRKGFVAVNLVTNKNALNQNRVHATAILDNTSFDSGSRYEDFNKSTDKIAEYGLAGLIAGGVGLGLLKVGGKIGILAILAKGGKGIFVAIAAGFAAVKRFFSRKPKAPSEPTA